MSPSLESKSDSLLSAPPVNLSHFGDVVLSTVDIVVTINGAIVLEQIYLAQ